MLAEKIEMLKNLRILYMEDNDELRENLTNVLSEIVLEIQSVENGEQGVELFKEYNDANKPIDIVLSDINMPNMDGLEAVNLIKQINKDIPVVFLTGHTTTNYLLKAINLGISYYISKPIDAHDLIYKLYNAYLPIYLQKELENKNKELERLNKKIIDSSKVEAHKYIQNEEDYIHFEEHINSLIVDTEE